MSSSRRDFLRRTTCAALSAAAAQAGFRKLGDLAEVPRDQVAAVPRVGRISMRRIDAALAEHNLSWAEAN